MKTNTAGKRRDARRAPGPKAAAEPAAFGLRGHGRAALAVAPTANAAIVYDSPPLGFETQSFSFNSSNLWPDLTLIGSGTKQIVISWSSLGTQSSSRSETSSSDPSQGNRIGFWAQNGGDGQSMGLGGGGIPGGSDFLSFQRLASASSLSGKQPGPLCLRISRPLPIQ